MLLLFKWKRSDVASSSVKIHWEEKPFNRKLRFNNHLNFAHTIFAILFDEYRITWALTLVLHLIHIYQRLRIFYDKDRQKLVLLPRRCNWCLAETLRNRFVFLWLEIKSFTLFPSNLSPWRAGGARWRPVGPRDRPAWLSTPCSRCSSQTSPASPRPPSTPPWTLRLDQISFLLLSYSTRNGNMMMKHTCNSQW